MKRVISDNDLKNLLEEKFLEYNTPHFIDSDPVQIPHRFKEKNDIEVSAFLTSIISWGNRKMINVVILKNFQAGNIVKLTNNSFFFFFC